MKPPSWASLARNFYCAMVMIMVWAGTNVAAATPEQAEATPAVLRIDHAQFIVSDSLSLPGLEANWQPILLPHHAAKPTGHELVGYWYKASFEILDSKQPQWVLFQQLISGGEIRVNGALVGAIPYSNDAIQVRWYLPELWLIPPAALHNGTNEIEVKFAIREPFTSFGEIEIGPEKIQRTTFDQLVFWEDTTADISTALCLIAGVLIIIFWIRRPQEKIYGLFGVCVVFWGIRTYLLRTPIVATDILLYWRFSYYFATAGFVVLISIFMLNFCGRANKMYNRFLIAYWLLGSLAFLLIGMPARHAIESYWLTGFVPLNLFAVANMLIYAFHQRTHNALAMGLAILFALGLSVHDLAVQEAWVDWPEIYLMHLGIPAFLLVMIGILLDRFLDSLAQVENVNEQLEHRVSLKEKELKQSYEQLRKLERGHAANEERQRIMQDMHDGVGSQLLTTLMMAQSSELSQKNLVALLQECLDDMRLVIDSLSPDDRDLLPVLGNFRYRMESRFRALGLNFEWRHDEIPDSLELEPNTGLQVLRILQEALANTLKHAQAKNIRVELKFSANLLGIRIIDDGIGFDGAGTSNGRGMNNMRTRAKKIAADFTITRLYPGTEVSLNVAF